MRNFKDSDYEAAVHNQGSVGANLSIDRKINHNSNNLTGLNRIRQT